MVTEKYIYAYMKVSMSGLYEPKSFRVEDFEPEFWKMPEKEKEKALSVMNRAVAKLSSQKTIFDVVWFRRCDCGMTAFALFPVPCDAFRSLQRWMWSHLGYNLEISDVHTDKIQTTDVYEDIVTMRYLAYNKELCKELFSLLVSGRRGQHTLTYSKRTHLELEPSQDTEMREGRSFYGKRVHSIEVDIWTPKGKKVNTIKIKMS